MSADDAIARLRAIAMTLPDAAEKVSHGMPVFYIDKGKTFAWFTDDHHGDGRTAVLVKTSGADEQDMLIGIDPDLYFRPAYMAHAGWIAIRTDLGDTDWAHIADRVTMSWRMVAPRRLLEQA